jgi:DNA-binding NarL/FixJ family response regulator
LGVVRTVVVDDSVLIREGVTRLLEIEPGVEVVAACASADEALLAVQSTQPDVLLTDIRMPPTHTDEGIVLAQTLRRASPRTGVVVLSQHLTPAYAIGLLGDGSQGRGYLLKDRLDDLAMLTDALRTVAGGGCQIDPEVVEALTTAGSRPASLSELTKREREILADIAEGASNQAIAQRRSLTRGAVEKHASSIFQKLGLTEDHDVNRRVRAVLVFLAERGDA